MSAASYLVAAWGTRGDVQPALALARALQGRGHQVVLAAPDGAGDAARRLGVTFEALGDDPRGWFDADPSRRRIDPLRAGRSFVELFRSQVDPQFETLLALSEGVDAVVGQGMMYAAKSVAEYRNVPYHYLCPNPFMLRSSAHPPIGVPFANPPRWVNRVAWTQFSAFYRLSFRGPVNERRKALGLAPIGNAYAHVFDAEHAILCMDPELYPSPPDWRSNRAAVGAFHLASDGDLDPVTDRFLAAGDAPVYVGFGSMTDPDPVMTTQLIVEAARVAGRRVVISRGWAGLGTEVDSPDVHMVSDVNHAALFRHVDVVVHHGGVGTASAAARAGVPQVVVPHAYDQPASGHCLLRAGVASASIPRRRLTVDRLAVALHSARAADLVESVQRVSSSIKDRDSLAAARDWIERTAESGPNPSVER